MASERISNVDGDTRHSEGGIPSMKSVSDDTPWDVNTHVLALSSFPGMSVLRNEHNKQMHGTCACSSSEQHRSLFHLQRWIIGPSMKNDQNIPAVKVCWNAENLFESKLRQDGVYNNRRFEVSNLKTVGDLEKVLFKKTYWFRRFANRNSANSKKFEWSNNGVALLRLLAGMSKHSGKESVREILAMPIKGLSKLRNILASIDGMVYQLIISFPDQREYNNWSRIDQIQNCLLSLLVPDYFRENDHKHDRISAYEKLKKLRGAIKQEGFNPSGDVSLIEIPREISFLEKALSLIGSRNRPVDIYRVATLCQTRAAGVPPRSVYFKTLLKLKETLTVPKDPSVYQKIGRFIRPCVNLIHSKILDKLGSETRIEGFWADCLSKAKVSLSDSGEFFTNSESGGKLEACRKVLQGNPAIPKIDLVTGQVTGVLDPDSTVGEKIFYWACSLFHDRKRVYDRNVMSVRISLVAELGKYRAITVSHLAHAVLLHVLSHVLLEYLKAIPSSESGVGAANHAWNFFKRISHKNPNANFIFGDKNDVLLFSTDWEQATDFCDHSVSQAILNNLCICLGIPNWYRQTCVFALCAPRQVEFVDPEGKTLERFFTSRGELMGDPVVKVILHYDHLVAREALKLLLWEHKMLLESGKVTLAT